MDEAFPGRVPRRADRIACKWYYRHEAFRGFEGLIVFPMLVDTLPTDQEIIISKTIGPLAQLARAPARHAGGHRFESRMAHSEKSPERLV